MAVGSALGVRASERRTVALVAALMFVSLAGAAIGESAVNALFFDRIGTQALPLMYLAQAGTTLVAMFASDRASCSASRTDRSTSGRRCCWRPWCSPSAACC